MPWHADVNPKINYADKTILLDGKILHGYSSALENHQKAEVTSISVKKFRRVRWQENRAFVFGIRQMNNIGAVDNDGRGTVEDKRLQSILGDFDDVFRADLPPGLPLKRTVDHEIGIDPDSKIPHSGLYQLSPNELHATRDYIIDLLNKKVIRPSKNPFGAPLFFREGTRKGSSGCSGLSGTQKNHKEKQDSHLGLTKCMINWGLKIFSQRWI